MIGASEIYEASILVVDDQAANISLLEQVLHGAGYISIKTTTDPRLVCDLHHQNRYDLILLDLQMPGMDGFQVMEQLKETEPGGYLPVLVITAQPDHRLRALKAGAKDFITKPFDLAEVLLRVYNMLEIRLLHLEMKRIYERVMTEQKRSERLLLNILPQTIAERLKGRPGATADAFTELIADNFSEVSVLFVDIVDFTRFAERVSPATVVQLLNDLFTCFDRIADARGLEKIKTIGDAYMAAAGLPAPAADHAARAAHMALDILAAMASFNQQHATSLQIRLGISSGSVVAGVIGQRRFQYDVWGDTVNMASRMESEGVPDRIQITAETCRRLGPPFVLERRGPIEVKGKGSIVTWFLEGRASPPPAAPPAAIEDIPVFAEQADPAFGRMPQPAVV